MTGTSISELGERTQISKNDVLVLSKKQNLCKISDNRYSQKISYSSFTSQTLQKLSSMFSFGTMAFENKGDYALVSHANTHINDYNYVTFDFKYTSSKDTTTIAKIKRDNTVYQLRIPNPQYPQQKEPPIGQVKFVAIPNPAPVNVYSTDFDGWVYADGASYSIADFKYSDRFEQCATDKFCVPLLEDMIYMDTNTSTPVDTSVVEQQNDLLRHTHDIPFSLSGNCTGIFKFKSGKNKELSSEHGTHSSQYSESGKFNVDINVNFNDVQLISDDPIHPCEEIGQLTLPTLQRLPVMIYIGRRNDQYV